MQRRQFLKNSVLLSAAGFVGPSIVSQTVQAAEPLAAPVARRRFVLSQTYQLNPPQGSRGVVKLWIPLPVDTAFQQMTNLVFTGNYKQAYITTNNTYGAKTLFASWPDSQGELLIKVDIEIETTDWEPLKHDALKPGKRRRRLFTRWMSNRICCRQRIRPSMAGSGNRA